MQNGDGPAMPFSEDGERGLLSSLMRSPGAVHKQCASVLWPDSFYIPAHRLIYEAVSEWPEEDRSVELFWLSETLRQQGNLEEVGGKLYLNGLIDFVPSAANYQFYLDTVLAAYYSRRVILLGRAFENEIKDPHTNCTETLQTFYDNVAQISQLARPKGSWIDSLDAGACSSQSLVNLDPIPRIPLIEDWCCESDLGYIFAARGLGKTWLAMHLAHGLATGSKVGPWAIHGKSKILYLDGEMPAAEIKRRDFGLGDPTDNLVYINHEILFERTGKVMNLADPEFQEATLATCKSKGFNMLFLDNLSTLASGIDENKTIDWELIQPWLLRLRRARITVVFIHHAGRNNEMRGVSKREDPASWILRLDEANDASDSKGAHFISRFTKWRNAIREPMGYSWTYMPGAHGKINVHIAPSTPMDMFRSLIENGLDTCSMIAEEMGVTAGYVSRLATQAENQGWLDKSGRKYKIAS